MDPSRRSRFNPDEKYVGPKSSPDKSPSDSPIRRREPGSRISRTTDDVSKSPLSSKEDVRSSSGSRLGGRISRQPVRRAVRMSGGVEPGEEDEKISAEPTLSQERVAKAKDDLKKANQELFESGKIDRASFEVKDEALEKPLETASTSKTQKGSRKEVLEDNEDASGLLDFEGGSLFALADGHGDKRLVADFATNDLLRGLRDKIVSGTPPEIAFEEGIREGQAKVMMNRFKGGACVIATHLDKTKGVLTVATLGDAEAMVIRDGKANKLSLIRDWNHKEEQNRATPKDVASFTEQAGQQVKKPYIRNPHGRSVNFSRSLGDTDFPGVVSQTPKVTQVNAKPGDTLILATDGLWDVMSYDDVADVANSKPDNLAQALIDEAKRKGSDDDITVQIVTIK